MTRKPRTPKPLTTPAILLGLVVIYARAALAIARAVTRW